MKRQLYRIAAAILTIALSMVCFAETTTRDDPTQRLIALGYLSKEYTKEGYQAALRDFRRGNDLPEGGDTLSASEKALLMGENARSQSEYIAAMVQAMNERAELSLGAYGGAVKELQLKLKEYGYYHDVCNGAFNESTEEAVRRFRLACGLGVIGICDASVYLRLYEGEPLSYDAFLEQTACGMGDTGDNVRTLQVWLRKIGGSGFSVTGSYGVMTARAVKTFQKNNGLEETGRADIETIRAIAEAVLEKSAPKSDNSEPLPDWSTIAAMLREEGYAPADEYNAQSQLSVLKYQIAHGLNPTGTPDAELVRSLTNGVLPVSQDAPVEEPNREAIAEYAYSLVGKKFNYYSSYGFVEYVCLRNGVEIPEEGAVQMQAIKDMKDTTAGDIIGCFENEQLVWGVVYEPGCMVCVRSGLCVLHYPDMQAGAQLYKVVL